MIKKSDHLKWVKKATKRANELARGVQAAMKATNKSKLIFK
jgi:hypothetical protein